MKAKHTTGEWIYSKYNPCDFGVTSETGNGLDIALVREYGNAEEAEANAKLIATAPELLDALQNLIDFCVIIPRVTFTREGQVNFQKLLNKAANVIDKATE